jgi:glycosyltransferase involved in cell wall biosynthesis
VKVLDGADDAELPLLYGSACAFAFPSLYEGFGLPPLEAMACGTPVVATRASSLPEVLGDAALLVEPGDAEGMARAIGRLTTDRALAEAHRRAGLERAAGFSWDRAASEVLAAYRRVTEPFGRRAPRPADAAPATSSAVPGPRGPRQKILFCVRQNLWSLPGGDATQILRTRDQLQQLGVHVELWSRPSPPSHGSYDIAHLFHLTRLDTYVQALALWRARMPYVLSTIYWPTNELERRGYTGALRLLHLSVSEGWADLTKNGIRAMLADGDWRWAMLPGSFVPLEQRARFLVETSLGLLPNSEAEGQVMRELGGRRIIPVVNAADPPPAHPTPPREKLPEKFVLCAGRIEPRKNQLALVEALADGPLPLVLVGDPGPMHFDYYHRVQRAARRNAVLLPAHSREKLFGLYAAAEAHIAPAWYETPGLVSLEAAAAGTRVVTTDRGSTREYFGTQASYLDPGDKRSMRDAVERALATPRDNGLRERVLREFTWRRAAEQTLEAYDAALARRTADATKAVSA